MSKGLTLITTERSNHFMKGPFSLLSKNLKALIEKTSSLGFETVDLMDKLLVCNPRQRITASQALDHDYFWTDPLPADPKTCVVSVSPLCSAE